MEHPEPMPHALHVAMIAGYFQADRNDLMTGARECRDDNNIDSMKWYVGEARLANRAMIKNIKRARDTYEGSTTEITGVAERAYAQGVYDAIRAHLIDNLKTPDARARLLVSGYA